MLNRIVELFYSALAAFFGFIASIYDAIAKALRYLIFRLFIFSTKFQIKSAVNATAQIRVALAWLVRAEEPDYPWTDDVVEDESAILLSGVYRFLEQPISSGLEVSNENAEELASRVVDILGANTQAAQLKCNVFQLDAFIQSIFEALGDDDGQHAKQRAEAIAKARAIDSNTSEIDTKRVFELEEEAKKLRKQLRKKYLQAKTPRVDLPATQLGAVISFGSTLFLLSGYLYNSILLSLFDIKASLFFGLTDYLASSIDEIRYSLIAGLAAIAGVTAGFVKHSRLTGAERATMKNSPDRPYQFLVVVVVIGLALAIYDQRFQDVLFLGPLLVFLAAVRIIPYLARYFTSPSPETMIFASYFLVAFLVSLISGAFRAADAIRNADLEDVQKMRFEVQEPEENTSSWVTITANSSYFFFFDRDTGTAFAYPRSNVSKATARSEAIEEEQPPDEDSG